MILRLAHADDAGFLLKLRNDPETMAQSHHQEPVSAKEHKLWLDKTTDRVFIAEIEDIPVGTVKFSRRETDLEIGVSVAPEHRGKGYSSQILALALQEAWRPVVAYVRIENERSLRAFETAGFVRGGAYVRFTSS
jgi:RimJ/RimL family protein N-acetyltransferase